MSDKLAAALRDQDLTQVIDIYLDAADRFDASGDTDGACFLLTQAWVYALEADDARAETCRARLIKQGRERET